MEFLTRLEDAAGEEWVRQYEGRLQQALAHINHHVHPLVGPEADAATGERRSLLACRPRLKENQKPDLQACKSGFPLDNELCEAPLLICECIASARALPMSGPRSMLGDVLPRRNDAWVNAGARALVAFCCDNTDLKFSFRLPILEESHETLLFDVRRHPSCGERSTKDQARDMQGVCAAIAGYFGGYTAKMQPIGHR